MTCDFIQLANSGVQTLQPYLPGKPIEEVQRELGLRDVIKLASNENPMGASQQALDAARQALEHCHLYPDGAGHGLKARLTEELGVDFAQLTLGNGSNDLLEMVAHAWLQPDHEVIFSEYAFAVYGLATKACSARPVVVPSRDYGHDLTAMAEAITERTRIVFLANPNNPTGTWFSADALDRFLARVPEQVLVVLDEAYCEYVEASQYPDGLRRLAAHPNLIVMRTFSKIHGLAGLRVGYAVSSPQIADVLNRVRQPFNVNIPALAAAQAALDDVNHVEDSRDENASGLAQLVEGFNELGLEYIPSVANFVTFDCRGDAAPLYQKLLREGVIVRPLAGYSMPHHLRVTVGTAPQNERFLQALRQVLEG